MVIINGSVALSYRELSSTDSDHEVRQVLSLERIPGNS